VARSRRSRRQSPWNLLLAPATLTWFAVLSYALLRGLDGVRAETRLLSLSFSGSLVVAGIAVAVLMPAFLMANLSVWLIPPARRAMDREAREHPGAGFRESSLGLLKAALVTVPLGIAIALAGAWLS
jgi:hypothetical protein